MILSLRAKQTTFNEVLETLTLFAQISNIQVNAAKSAVFPIGPLSSTVNNLDISPFKWSATENCHYLGITVNTRTGKHNPNYHYGVAIIDHINSILSPRNSLQHTLFGWVLNVKTFISSKLNYFFSLAPAPHKLALQKAQSHINNYIWSYSIHYVKAKLFV